MEIDKAALYQPLDRIREYVGGVSYLNLDSHYFEAIRTTPMLLAFSVGALITALSIFRLNYGKAKPTLDPTTWQRFPLVEKEEISPNTARYRFQLPKKDSMLGLPIGQHLSVQVDVNGKMVQSECGVTSLQSRADFNLVAIR